MISQFQRYNSAQPFPAASSFDSFRSSNNNTLSTAKFLGTLGAGTSPARLNLRGRLSSSNPVDFFRIAVAPGASYSTQIDSGRIRGGKIRITSYLQLPGQPLTQPLTKIRSTVYSPTSYSKEFNSPFANTFGATLQVYTEVRRVNVGRTVTYQSQSLFR